MFEKVFIQKFESGKKFPVKTKKIEKVQICQNAPRPLTISLNYDDWIWLLQSHVVFFLSFTYLVILSGIFCDKLINHFASVINRSVAPYKVIKPFDALKEVVAVNFERLGTVKLMTVEHFS